MTRDDYDRELAILQAGGYTCWHDETGTPAPHPIDFYLQDGTINPNWQPGPPPITVPADYLDGNPF